MNIALLKYSFSVKRGYGVLYMFQNFSLKISSVFYPIQQNKYPYSHRVNESNLCTFDSSRTDAQKELSAVETEALTVSYARLCRDSDYFTVNTNRSSRRAVLKFLFCI